MSSKTRKRRKSINRKSIRNHINKIFNGVVGSGLDQEEYDPKYATTYGELTVEGIEKLVQEYQKEKPIESYPSERRVFYDLGSGTGKIVMMIAALVPALQSYGIELVKHRHEKAVYASQQSKKNRNVHFIHGSMFDHSIRNAGWIFISNLCFSESINEDMARKIEEEVQADTLIACSVELPLQNPNAFEHRLFTLPMTWEKESSVHLYRKI